MAAKTRSPLVEIDLRGDLNDEPSAGGQRFGRRSQPGSTAWPCVFPSPPAWLGMSRSMRWRVGSSAANYGTLHPSFAGRKD